MSRLSTSDIDEIIERIAANDPTLTDVNLRGEGLGDDGAVRIAAALRGNTHVTELDLEDNRIGVVGAKALAGIVADNSTITYLDLEGNQIGDDGATVIAAALRTNAALTKLYLGNNQIGDDGATALAGILADNSAVTQLWLGGNQIGDDGAASIAAALRSNATITILDLKYNQIGNVGATSIAGMLSANSAITYLESAYNQIGDDGATAFVNALWSNTALTTFWLSDGNSISAELDEDIAELTRINAEEEEPEDARRSKIVYRIGRLAKVEDGAEREAAVDLALDELAASFPEVAQRRGLFEQLLCSPERGADVARSVETVPRGRALYWYAAECGAAPAVLMNILRAHPSLCGTCRDVRHKLYPFMLLATLPNSKVGDVMELLLENPSLVEGGIPEDIPKKEG